MIVKVYGAAGELLHDCAARGCSVSWDGYVLVDGYVVEQPNPDAPGETMTTALKQGGRVPNAADPGDEWDTSSPGVARLKPRQG